MPPYLFYILPVAKTLLHRGRIWATVWHLKVTIGWRETEKVRGLMVVRRLTTRQESFGLWLPVPTELIISPTEPLAQFSRNRSPVHSPAGAQQHGSTDLHQPATLLLLHLRPLQTLVLNHRGLGFTSHGCENALTGGSHDGFWDVTEGPEHCTLCYYSVVATMWDGTECNF